jgi:hypothetical protein
MYAAGLDQGEMNCPLDSIKAEPNHVLLAHKVAIPLVEFLLR